MSLIEFKNVTFYYSDESPLPAVKNLDLAIDEGEFVALVGHNGSGKSTVAKLMNGLVLPDEGDVTVDGMSTLEKNLFEIRKTVGVVFQNPDNQMIATVIEDDIAFGPENLGLEPKKIRERVDWALESVGMLSHATGTPYRLSGGQKQRIAIAGVLAVKPRVMVLDESTAMLDPVGRKEVLDVIEKLRRDENMTVVMITHFMEEAARADRIVVLNKGEKLLDGGKEIFKEKELLESIGLELPLASRVAERLRVKGHEIGGAIVDTDSLLEELCR